MSTWNKFCFRGGYIESESMAGNIYTDEHLTDTSTSTPFVLSSQPRFAWYKLCLRVSPDRDTRSSSPGADMISLAT